MVLLALEKSIDGYARLEDFTYNTHLYSWGYDRHIKKPLLAQTIKRLRERGLIDFIDQDKLLFKLSSEGLDQAIRIKLRKQSLKEWNGRWTMVSFDIPEKRRSARDLLRIRLKEWGLKPLQKSLWITKKDCAKELRSYIGKLGIKDWVKVIESDNLDF